MRLVPSGDPPNPHGGWKATVWEIIRPEKCGEIFSGGIEALWACYDLQGYLASVQQHCCHRLDDDSDREKYREKETQSKECKGVADKTTERGLERLGVSLDRVVLGLKKPHLRGL